MILPTLDSPENWCLVLFCFVFYITQLFYDAANIDVIYEMFSHTCINIETRHAEIEPTSTVPIPFRKTKLKLLVNVPDSFGDTPLMMAMVNVESENDPKSIEAMSE